MRHAGSGPAGSGPGKLAAQGVQKQNVQSRRTHLSGSLSNN